MLPLGARVISIPLYHLAQGLDMVVSPGLPGDFPKVAWNNSSQW